MINQFKILSGGQTGVDRAALDYAIENNINHGGYCPKGRKSEDGRIPDKYNLKETSTSEYSERTEKNLTETDGTLIVIYGNLTGGSKLTFDLCNKLKKPVYVVDASLEIEKVISEFKRWFLKHNIKRLNIAGPRASEINGVFDPKKVIELLIQ